MKRFAVGLFVVLFSFAVAGVAFAGDDVITGGTVNSGITNGTIDSGITSGTIDSGISNGTVKERQKMTFDEYIEKMKEEGQTTDEDINSAASGLILPKMALINTSILSNELANAILDNTGNYTFFKKQGSNAGDVEDRCGATMYIKGFGGQEKLDLKDYDYTEFETTYYGAILGLDWDRQYSDCFDATYGIFVSYAGSELKDKDFEDNKINQDAGFAGLRGIWYAGKFFLGAVADYGFIQNKSDFTDDYNTQSIGFSAKACYNFEVSDRSFTIQPNIVFNSNYLIQEDIENKEDNSKLEADDMLNMAAAPGIKIAKTLGKCWILSAEGKYVFAFSNGDMKFSSDIEEIIFPEVYYKDYASCGLGIEKIWGYTVLHLKGHKTFGGKDGYMINAGIEFKF